MKEQEYLIATNLAKVTIAIKAIDSMLEGCQYGVSKPKYRSMLRSLYDMQEKLFDKVSIKDEGKQK